MAEERLWAIGGIVVTLITGFVGWWFRVKISSLITSLNMSVNQFLGWVILFTVLIVFVLIVLDILEFTPASGLFIGIFTAIGTSMVHWYTPRR